MVKKNLTENLIIFLILFSLFLFILYPFTCMIFRSIQVNGIFSLENYKEIIFKYKQIIINSLYVAFLSSILSTFLSTTVSIFMCKINKTLKNILYLIILLAFVSPPFVSSLSYLILYGRRGMITYGLLGLSLNPYNEYGIILMQSISFAPLNIIFLMSIIDGIDRSSINSALDLGANGKNLVFDIILPLIKKNIFMIFILTFVRSICDFATPTVVGGRYSTFASEIYMQIVGFSNIDKAAAMNVVIMIPSLLIFILYLYLTKNNDNTNISRTESNERLEIKKAGFIGFIINFVTIIYIIFISLQYFSIIFYSIFKKSGGTYKFTMEYVNSFFDYDFSSLIRSIIYAIIVSIICSLIAIIISYIRRASKNIFIEIISIIIMLPFMIPGTYFGLSYILAFNSGILKLTGTATIVIANIIFKQLPMTTKMCEGAFFRIDKALDNSALDLGANKFNIIFDIIIPKIKASFLVMMLYNFNSAMTTAGSILFLINPGRKLAIFDLFDSIYIGEYHEACILSVMIIISVILFSSILKLLQFRLNYIKE